MKILGVIPSRYESSRFPGKPLIDLNGKTMIQRVYKQAQKSKLLSKIVVATDHEEIHEHVNTFGNCVFTSKDHQSGTDRCEEVLSHFPDFDIIINIQGDEPLIHPKQIDQLCKLMSKKEVAIGTLIKKFEKLEDIINPNRIKVTIDSQGKALYFSRSPIPYYPNPENVLNFWRHIGLYGYQSETLKRITALKMSWLEQTEKLEQLRWLENGHSIFTAETKYETPNIDTPEDVDVVLKYLSSCNFD